LLKGLWTAGSWRAIDETAIEIQRSLRVDGVDWIDEHDHDVSLPQIIGQFFIP
jgi:hypothetical protein